MMTAPETDWAEASIVAMELDCAMRISPLNWLDSEHTYLHIHVSKYICIYINTEQNVIVSGEVFELRENFSTAMTPYRKVHFFLDPSSLASLSAESETETESGSRLAPSSSLLI